MHLPGLLAARSFDAKALEDLVEGPSVAARTRGGAVTYTEIGDTAGSGVSWLRATLRRQSAQQTPKDTAAPVPGVSLLGITEQPAAWRRVRRLAPLPGDRSPTLVTGTARALPPLWVPGAPCQAQRRREDLSDSDNDDSDDDVVPAMPLRSSP